MQEAQRDGDQSRRGRPRSTRSASVTPKTSPKSSDSIPGGDCGESASSTPRPNIVVTTTATAASRLIAGDPRGKGDRQRRDDDRRHRAEQQRHAGDRGEDEPGEDRVGERLGRVGEAVEDDPAAERTAGDADQDDLGEGALHERFLQGLEHLSGGDGEAAGSPGRRCRGSRRWRRRRSLRARRGRRAPARAGPQATWRLLMQRTRSQPRACSRSWVAIDDPPPLPRQLGDQRFQSLGAGPIEARRRARRAAARRRPGPAPGRSARAGAGRRRGGRRSRSARRPQADPVERLRRRLALAPARPPPPGQPRERAHRRHVEGRDRVVEARALGLGHGAAGRADAQRPLNGRSSPSTARSRVVLPPPLGPSRASVWPAARVNSTPEIAAVPVVAGAEAGRLDQGLSLHPRLPPVKPRTIEFALAASICR